MHFRSIAPSVFSAFLLFACSSSSNDGNGSSGGGSSSGNGSSSGTGTVSQADCSSRCEAKGKQCGATADNAKAGCDQVCGGGLTASQVDCLESKSCSELMSGNFEKLCPGSSSSSSSSSSSGSTTSSSGSTGDHFSCSLNGTCYKCPDSDSVEKCDLVNGPGKCSKTDSSYCKQQ